MSSEVSTITSISVFCHIIKNMCCLHIDQSGLFQFHELLQSLHFSIIEFKFKALSRLLSSDGVPVSGKHVFRSIRCILSFPVIEKHYNEVLFKGFTHLPYVTLKFCKRTISNYVCTSGKNNKDTTKFKFFLNS